MSFIFLLLDWYNSNKRSLPWRLTKDPYRVWISEIILQQTRVAQGTDYYNKFVELFPDVQTLALADEQEVLNAWQGLGYYSRARNLHFAAKTIVNSYRGELPNTYKELLHLKGIGKYTAAAIASICFDEAVPAMDGNAYRVYARLFAIDKDISVVKNQTYFFELGKEIIPKENPGDFNQAIMELGATVCLPKNPKCDLCPVFSACEAREKNIHKSLPVKSKKVKVKQRHIHYYILHNEGKLLLKKRTAKDVWQNLFDFPSVELDSKNQDQKHSFSDLNAKKFSEKTHLLTHQKLHLTFYQAEIPLEDLKNLSEAHKGIIVGHHEFDDFPLPRPIEKLLMVEEDIFELLNP